MPYSRLKCSNIKREMLLPIFTLYLQRGMEQFHLLAPIIGCEYLFLFFADLNLFAKELSFKQLSPDKIHRCNNELDHPVHFVQNTIGILIVLLNCLVFHFEKRDVKYLFGCFTEFFLVVQLGLFCHIGFNETVDCLDVGPGELRLIQAQVDLCQVEFQQVNYMPSVTNTGLTVNLCQKVPMKQ